MGAPAFGIQIRKIDEDPRPVLAADLSTIGIIGPADDADPVRFPLNIPVFANSNDTTVLSHLGADGFIADAIEGINDQLAETEFAARVVIVRTARGSGNNEAETIANICGSSILKTGLWAFTTSAHKLGFTPRILLAPGFTGQMANSLNTLEIASGGGGSGYTKDQRYELLFSGGGVGAFQAQAHAYGQSDGSLGPAIIDTYGGYYDSAPTVAGPAVSPGEAAVYDATIAEGANPVCATFTPILNQLLGHAIVESDGATMQDDFDWRETMQSQRLIPVTAGVKVINEDGIVVKKPLAPRMAGILVRRDHETGAPFHSAANQPIQGIVGPGRDIGFALTDDANEAQELLKANIGCVVRGEIGDDFAIAAGGFVLLSTDTASEDVLWKFYNVSRGRDFIHLGLLRALRFYLGRYNIVGHTIQAILNTMRFFLRDLQADQHILGYKVNFRASGNSAEQIRLGHLTVGFAAEEPPPLVLLTIESARYRPAIDAMVADLAAQLNMAV